MGTTSNDQFTSNRTSRNSFSLGGLTEINVTPLVDVMLVLLIIFMVTAPMMKHGIDVALPQASERLFPENSSGRYVLSVTSDKKIYIDGREIPIEHLEFKLKSMNENAGIAALFLEADKTLSYGYVVHILDIVKKAGIKNLGMVTRPKHVTVKKRR